MFAVRQLCDTNARQSNICLIVIPPFTADGVLPATPDGEPYQCAVPDVERRFVTEQGSPTWRRVLFDGWDLVRSSVDVVAPNARWWIWGSLVTDRATPLFGEMAVVDVALIIPVTEPSLGLAEVTLLRATQQSALQDHHVDIHGVVFESETDDERARVTEMTLEKLRSRATRNIVDDSTMQQFDAGFIEVVS